MLTDPDPYEVRRLCRADDPAGALDLLARTGFDAAALRRLLTGRAPGPGPVPGTREVLLRDENGRTTEMAVHTPAGAVGGRTGALVLLHGVGGSGPRMLSRFRDLAERLDVSVLCPTAQPVHERSNRLDLAGLFGNAFDAPCWNLSGADFPLAALRWARTELDADPDRCLIAGHSMGALATWNLAMRFGDRFCAAVPVNGALSMWELFGTDRRKRALLPNLLPLPVFVLHGDADRQIAPRFDRESVAALRGLGHPELRHAEIRGGGHTLESLDLTGRNAPLRSELADWLSARRRGRVPAAVRHRALDGSHGRAHWIAVDRIAPQAVAEVRAERRSATAIDVAVTGAREVRLHLRGDLFAPGRLDVAVNGVRHAVAFRPDPDRLLHSYRETADPALLDEQVVVLPVPDDREES
ncbi:hypothetical protein [Kitasatospora cineracea]|uniref:Esterase n=1 Tax=Kitasatospora cineracea TaxID=88074 RepID=A0A8G1UG10_9ACTN|nr:hypothetical protein [Kitasatospora cineracea]ROR43215.1 hypothetical protein EDD39_1359 [Kitasatospora cineracea]